MNLLTNPMTRAMLGRVANIAYVRELTVDAYRETLYLTPPDGMSGSLAETTED